MSTATLTHLKYHPDDASFQDAAKQVAEQARANGERFATYTAVEGGDGTAITCILHGDDGVSDANEAEAATSAHASAGAAALADGPKAGVHSVKTRTAHVTHHGDSAGTKPYALVLVVEYDADKVDDIKEAGRMLRSHNSGMRFHIVRRAGHEGHAMVVIPVDSLDEYHDPISDAAQPIADKLANAVKNVSLIKAKRVAEYSA